MNTSKHLCLVFLGFAILASLCGLVIANPPASLTVFQAGEPIRAAELNANLELLQARIVALEAALDERISTLEDAVPPADSPRFLSAIGSKSVGNSTFTNLGSTIALTPGDWIIFSNVGFKSNATNVNWGYVYAGLARVVSGALQPLEGSAGLTLQTGALADGNIGAGSQSMLGENIAYTLPSVRVRVTSNTDVGIQVYVLSGSVGNNTVRGQIYAERIR